MLQAPPRPAKRVRSEAIQGTLGAMSTARSRAALVLLVSLGTSGAIACSPPPPREAPESVATSEGYTLSFPGRVVTRKGRDGRAAFRIDFARTPEGARFEAAWFGFPDALSEGERRALLGTVEKGISGSGDVKTRGTSDVLGRESLDLVVDRSDGRRSVHHVLYPSPESMLQVSVSGPRGGDWEREEPRFWASLALTGSR